MPHHVHVTLTTADLASSVSIETSKRFPKLVEVCIPKETRWTRNGLLTLAEALKGAAALMGPDTPQT
jgi:hypothetical protein